MATIKLTIDRRRAYKDGRYPVVLRLTSLSQSTFINTDIRLQEKEWDITKNKVTKLHPDHASINLHLKKKLFELERKLIDINLQSADINVSELKEKLLNGDKLKNVTFLEFVSKEIQILRDQERYGNAAAYETAVNRLQYNGIRGMDMPFYQ